WLEGINDFAAGGASAQAVAECTREGVRRLRAKIPGVRIYMATVMSSLNSNVSPYGTPDVDAKRKEFNNFIRTAGIFDGVIDLDPATWPRRPGERPPETHPNPTTGGPGKKIPPNRAGYAAMGPAIALDMTAGKP